MARSQETFGKKEVRKKKEKKKKDKEKRRSEKKDHEQKKSLDDMIAYVDENGNISNTPPEEKKKEINTEDIEISIPKRDPNEEVDPVKEGKLIFFNDSKGYGFLREAETGEKIFVHINNCIDELDEGDNATFEVERGKKGLVAVNVRKKKT